MKEFCHRVFRVFTREGQFWLQSGWPRFLILYLPAITFGCILLLFSEGVPRELPIGVVHGGGDKLGREWVRTVDAHPGVKVIGSYPNPESGFAAIRRGEIHAILWIPSDTRISLHGPDPQPVVVYYNAQYLLVANLLNRDIQTALLNASGQVQLARELTDGDGRPTAIASAQPLRSSRESLFNPYLNYMPFLGGALLPTLLHMLVLIWSVSAFGRELKEGTVGHWLRHAGGSRCAAVLGKLMWTMLAALTWGLLILACLWGWLGWGISGSVTSLLVGLGLMLWVYACLGLLLVVLSANYRLSLSLAAFISAPALAFAGITYPAYAMPMAGSLWSRLLPLSHYLQLQQTQALRMGTWADSRAELYWLLVAGLCVISVAALFVGRLGREELWGKS